ncbi:hypothetical protein SKAU_G00101490 [Synaphobranchus kaupii]|uniref:LEM domain-containing protein n=1 Tax=Synaphobranchus kaupii TaxID=118154 RepID=A0A9Q1FYN4_SYNKA|nr:hypothetical protein SKAU_G00101490 [Synaphobranchus kaupii]
MTALGIKSAEEISDLLNEYGIKHGPIVDSTRGLYEKKLREAMAKDTPVKPSVKPSSDKTYYREEREEITYVHRRVPLRSEAFIDGGRSYTSTANYREPEDESGDHGRSYTSTANYREPEDESGDQPSMYRSEVPHRYVSQSKPPPLRSASAATRKESSSTSGRLIPLWLQFLVFLVVAAFLYYVFTSMEIPENNPFERVE